MIAAAKSNGADVAVDAGSTSVPGRNIHQRIAAVIAEAVVKVTGNTQYGKAAMSIEDVEKAIAVLMVKNGITTRWSDVDLASYEEKTKDGSMLMWRRSMNVTVTNADEPEDNFTDLATDVGSNPAAAASFARKGYYKALFHLADPSDDVATTHTATGATEGATASPRGSGGKVLCAECDRLGLKNKRDYPAVFWPDSTTCDGGANRNGKFTYVNHKLPVEEDRPLTGVGNAVQLFADGSPIPDDPT